MSVNRYTTAGGLQTLANGQRIWVGTESAHQQEKLAGTLPKDCLVAIIDDDKELMAEDVGYNPHDIIFHTLREEYPSASDSEIETMVQQVLNGGDLSEYPTDVQDALDELYDTAVDLQDQIDYTVETTVDKNSFVYENLIEYPYYNPNIHIANSVTFKVNSDGSITANGTATGGTAIFFCRFRESHNFKAGTYTLNGCPSNGSTQTYYMWMGFWTGSSNVNTVYEVGNGATINIQQSSENYELVIGCYVYNGQTVNNLTFKPMLIKDSEAHEYQPPTANIKNRVGILEEETAINLVPYPYRHLNGRTINGITWTVYGDGSVTGNGTATADTAFQLRVRNGAPYWYLEPGTYTVSGCPSTGSTSTYYIHINGSKDDGTNEGLATDTGNGATFTIDRASATRPKGYNLVVKNGITLNNVIFKPMLEKGFVAHDYKPTTKNLENRVTNLENVGENLIPYPYYHPNTFESNGITFTVNKDGSITTNGTATADAIFNLGARTIQPYWLLDAGQYILSGCPAGGGTDKYYFALGETNAAGTGTNLAADTGNQVIFEIDSASAQRPKQTIIIIKSGQTVSNLTFYPMLEKGNVAHTYKPTIAPSAFDLYENKMDKSGGTFTGDLWISPTNQIGDLNCGQNTVNGYEGAVTLWGKDATNSSANINKAVTLRPGTKLTANRTFTFPNISGEIAVNTDNNANYVYTPTVIEVTPQVGTKVKCGYFKCGYLVTFFFTLSSVPTGTNTICTLPAGYRPYTDVLCHTIQENCYFVVNSGGPVKVVNNQSTASSISGYCTFIACN